jgi:hypothetical protein
VRTVAELIESTGVDVLDYLDRQASVPVLTAPQIQGDVSFLPADGLVANTPIPAAGVVVASGREGHDHRLVGVGFFDIANDGGVGIGVLTVPEGAEVYAAHDEHGFMGFGPGTYRVGRQREQADIIAFVAD